MSITSMKIRSKLGCIVALLLIPIALLAWLFIQQSGKDIAFARKERDGVTYLNGVWPLMKATIVASNRGEAPSAHLRNAPDLAALGKTYDGALESEDATRALAGALNTLGWPNRPLARNADAENAIAAARTLLTKIADGSNLTLDPDIDSYYVMDVVTIKLPELVDRLGIVAALAQAQRGQAKLSDDDKAELMIQLGQFASAATGAMASLESAYKGNADGEVKRKLEAPAKAFAQITTDFVTLVKAVAVALRDDEKRAKVDLSRLNDLYGQSMTAADTLWQASNGELDRLLVVRTSGFTSNLWTMLAIAALITMLALAAALYITRGITDPLRRTTVAINGLAAGDFTTALPDIRRRDEIGEIVGALRVFKERMIESEQLRSGQAEAEKRAAVQRKADMHQVADSFQAVIGGIVASVSSASGELESAASTLTRTADTTQQLSARVASASEEASTNVQSVASATDELTASVSEIARQVNESSRIAGEAVRQAQATDARIGELSQAASRIGDVVKLITAIAEQTNLLALNATIEAARAGEAGRGFAVVAQEVKALAAQTAKATDEIGAQIGGMQTATQDSVAAIKEIGGTINRVSEIAATIAAAVEEQGAATAEIARNVQRAAEGTTQVAGNVTEVSQGAAETGTASTKVLSSAQALSSEGSKLKLEVDRFLATVRAA
jgi:methyl-accepting chemotaxis protein